MAVLRPRVNDIIGGMNKHAIILSLSIAIIIVPILGFPGSWKSFFTIILALAAAIISYRLYRADLKSQPKRTVETPTFVDNLHSSVES